MPRLRLLLLLGFCLTLVGCDHATKELALAQFRDAPLRFGALTLTYAENRDMAFGLLGPLLDPEARLWVLSCAKACAVVGGAAFLLVRHAKASLRELLAVSFVIAGAGGNLVDRVTRGFVVDFLRVPHWPVFNVADVAICVGYGLLLLGAFETRAEKGASSPRRAEPSDR